MAKPESAKLYIDRAYRAMIHRGIPTDRATQVVNGAGTFNLATYGGKAIWLGASGAAVTILRNGGGTIVAGEGMVLTPGDALQELFVDPGGEMVCAVNGTSATLVILFDAE